MVALIVFWSAVVCILFFILGAFFKGLASVFNGLITAIMETLSLVVLGALGMGVLMLVFMIAQAIASGDMGNFWGFVVILIVDLVLIVGIFGGLASAIFGLIGAILLNIIAWISLVLESIAVWCQNVYVKFLNVIIDRFEKY